VDGQVIRVGPADAPPPADWGRPLDGSVAVVTGAARGIGAAIAEVLARDGAHVIVLDLPSAGEQLTHVANRIGGTTLQLDIAATDAPERLISYLRTRHGGADVLIHNAGITRDRLLANMTPDRWDAVIAVNLESQLRINAALLDSDVLRHGARVVCLASTSGIAGNRGQTNYAASKAGVIGMVRASAPLFAQRGGTINAVAPGFIDTEMTHAMPFATREFARRFNSLQQAGLPVDVAETVSWLAWPATRGVNGQLVRICGQSLIGA
jgi:3-oxoacyl-[acyl-carrier protein] reductase